MKFNLDLIYQTEYDKVYRELSSKVITTLNNPSKNSLLFKRDLLIKEFNDTFNTMTMEKIGPSNYMPDKYTERLLRDFKGRFNDYVDDEITNFIEDHLEKIKEAFKGVELSIPSNIKLNAKQTVEFIANHDALEKFIHKLNSIQREDSIEICEKKISNEGYMLPVVEEAETNLDKIEWLGTQKELGELFVELFRKGWISSIDDKLISAYFTNSNTISQIVKKGEKNKITNEYPYEIIYTKKYSRKFDGIKIKKTNMK